mmetsp:Transcript_57636/g.78588  ORF Transcript_57636/g.78588 Transcript_57636/m.78588 type:complete len:124 (-) Transcript_57636:762-1133(-)
MFLRRTAIWFCTHYVGMEIPDISEIDTVFKVGTWTWQWMEPMLGTATFVLISLQLSRAHMQNINEKPYHGYVMSWRADRLINAFPNYEREIVRDYAKSDPWNRNSFMARQGYPANSLMPPSHR